jgi:hypothetical protein
MKNYLIIILLLPQLVNAALAPDIQDKKDLNLMENFVEAHAIIKTSLKSIDLQTYTIYFADDCEAKFIRAKNDTDEELKKGWVGPAGPSGV